MNRVRFLDHWLIGDHSSRGVGALLRGTGTHRRRLEFWEGLLDTQPGPGTEQPSRWVLSCPLPTRRLRAATDITQSLVISVGPSPAHPIPLNMA